MPPITRHSYTMLRVAGRQEHGSGEVGRDRAPLDHADWLGRNGPRLLLAPDGLSMTLSLRRIEEMAPGQESLKAAQKLLPAKPWRLSAQDPSGGLIWGECQGSGSTPYRLLLAVDDFGFRCSCPSRKLPCKHVLALGWRY